MPRPFLAPIVAILLIFATSTCALSAPSGSDIAFDDGPHAFYQAGGIDVSWVCGGVVVRRSQLLAGAVIDPVCGFNKPVAIRDDAPVLPAAVKFTARKIAALSDVHGQFDTMVALLQAHGVIDQRLKWSFGDGHLVMTGDMFDRGPQVTEVLWLLYQLESEARSAGGALHVLLGNHETMIFYDDLRYVNSKYQSVSQALSLPYPELFSARSVLGRWLRQKPVIVQINEMLFLHGGLGPEFAAHKLSIEDVNEAFRQSLGMSRATIKATPLLNFLYGANGPVWYRAYFREPRLAATDLESLLRQRGVRRIVVGHTTMNGVFSHYGGKVISIDSNIQSGSRGELLLWQAGTLTRGTLAGERKPIAEYSGSGEPQTD